MKPAQLRTTDDLVGRGFIAPEDRAQIDDVVARYALSLTPEVAGLIDPDDPNDPIARQFVPDAAELDSRPEELADPIGDDAHSPVEGIVHRYPDRVLLKVIHVCPVYCRFCFRREMVGPGRRRMLSDDALAAAIDYVRSDAAIWEVILTGGDPLILSLRRLTEVMRALASIDHVKVVRFHTRVPVVDPSRVTAELVDAVKVGGKATYVVLHANHAREFTPAARAACARLVDAGIPMLSQSVLLRGVNDDAASLTALMRTLVECRIKPYYLHHPDLAPGTAHLRTTIAAGQSLMRTLHGRTSGLCQPAYVLDIPGGHGKAPIGPVYMARGDDAGRSDEPTVGGADDGGCLIEDFNGRRHRYPPTPRV